MDLRLQEGAASEHCYAVRELGGLGAQWSDPERFHWLDNHTDSSHGRRDWWMDISGRFAKRKLFQTPRRSPVHGLKCACHWHWLPARAADCTYVRCHSLAVPKIPGRCLVAYTPAGSLAWPGACVLLLACSLGSARVAAELAAGGGDDPPQPPAPQHRGRVARRPFPGPGRSPRPILRQRVSPAARPHWQPSESDESHVTVPH